MHMVDEQVNRIIAVITTTTTTSEEQIRNQLIEGFQEVKSQLHSLINAILEKVLEANVLQRTGKLRIAKRV